MEKRTADDGQTPKSRIQVQAKLDIQPPLRCTHTKLDAFRSKLKRFMNRHEDASLPSDPETISNELKSLIQELGQLAPEAALSVDHVTSHEMSAHLRGILGSSPIRLAGFLEELDSARAAHLKEANGGASEQKTFYNRRKQACVMIILQMSGTIYAMRQSLVPVDRPMLNSPHAKEVNTAHFKLVKRFAEAYAMDAATNESQLVLQEYAKLAKLGQRSQHVVALIELRDALQTIFEQKYDQPTATRNLLASMKEYKEAVGRPNILETDAIAESIDCLASAPTNEVAREAITTISSYTHQFLTDFNNQCIGAYKSDHERLKQANYKALEFSSQLLDVTYDVRWAGAAHTMFEQISLHEATLRTPSKNVTQGLTVTSWSDFARQVREGTIGVGKSRGSKNS